LELASTMTEFRAKVGSRTMIRESELARVIEDGGKSPTPRRLGAPGTSTHSVQGG
jgi:hypothetical protein